MNPPSRCWAIIPAAGIGTRMSTDKPKQYLKLRDKTVLEYSVRLFCDYEKISGVMVVLAESDPYWASTGLGQEARVFTTSGGVARCHSVQNGLKALKADASPNDWVLVHDAARPCLQRADLDKMILILEEHPVGGLLAMPAIDTIKRADEHNIVLETVSRQGLWHALTPQMFRFALLESALDNAIGKDILVTDEAEAIELSGKQPMLIEGASDNIKITQQRDLELAELYLSQQEVEL
jgi:2-C-methyl-D-erythritol 4-phosphate cytidylyltransferase